MTQKHTPTPSQVALDNFNCTSIGPKGCHHSLLTYCKDILGPESSAQIRLVLNAHDQLVAALKRAKEINLECLENDRGVQYVEMHEIVELANASLAKVQS